MASLLEHLDNLVLVFRKDLRETISSFDKIVLSCSRQAAMDKFLRVVNLCSESQHLASFLCDGNSVSSKHLNRHAKLLGFDNGLSSVLTWRIKHGEQS